MRSRRFLSIPAVVIALPLLLIAGPFLLIGAAIVDVAHGLRQLPTVRLGLFAVVYLVHEWVGLIAAVLLWVRQALVGRRWDRPTSTERYRRVQAWWTSSLLRWARRLVGIRYELPDPATLPAEPFILVSRHASMIDAVIPADVITNRLERFAHYVLKAELRWVPNLDLFGHRLGNYFVTRAGDGDAEAEAIARFATQALPHSALVIFPEGTYSTPTARKQVIASLERRGETHLADYARSLNYLLPPKPAGTLALLDQQPTLDVVVFGHVGLEGVAQLGGLRRRLPLQDPVVVEWWHHPRAELPDDDEGRIAWLNDRWRTLDAWVGSVGGGNPSPSAAGRARRDEDGKP
jgi:1-acyl-sn-glycerol-3-phosphate acyltransferase